MKSLNSKTDTTVNLGSSDILVIFPTWNRLEYNKMTLPLLIHECANSKDFKHLLIIDDLSTDGTSQWIKSLPLQKLLGKGRVTYMRQKMASSTKQWNLGRQEAIKHKCNFIANFTNENMIPFGALTKLKSRFKKNVFAVGGQLSGNPQNRNGVITAFPFITNEDKLKEVAHIGCGMIRVDLMNIYGDIPVKSGAKKLFGFTEYQNKLKKNRFKILLDESIRFVRLDQSPIYSRSLVYHKEGLSRLLNSNPNSVLNQ